MAPSTSKSAEEIQGLEFDWLGSDETGCVALFSTAGAGYAPAEFLLDTDAHDSAIRLLIALPATTKARFSPPVAAGLVNTWRLVAERGLYAYDCDPNGGPYRLVAAPFVPTSLDVLLPAVADVASKIRCPVRFETQSVIREDTLNTSS